MIFIRAGYPGPMLFAYAINDEQSEPDKEVGFVEAESVFEALDRLGPGANVYSVTTPRDHLWRLREDLNYG